MIYHCARHGFPISHLAYADDILIFTQAKRESLVRLVDCLAHYSAVSGQMVNSGKSNFYIDPKFEDWAALIQEVGGYQRGLLPFTYLGVPLFRGYRRADHLLALRQKMTERIHSWSHRHLSFGGRLALIKSTLATIPLHILQVMEPLQGVLHQLEQLMARFFWGTVGDQRKTHWVSWEQICLPVDEGGLGIRRFSDLVTAFSYKLWWRLLAQNSLWAQFTVRKYCILSYYVYDVPYSRYDSCIWRRLSRIWRVMHASVRWSLGDGRASFWDDVWFGDRTLRSYCHPEAQPRPAPIYDFWRDHAWDLDRLHSLHALHGVPFSVLDALSATPIDVGGRDMMRWALTSHGEFSVTSAWDHVRRRLPKRPLFGLIWSVCLTPTISVFLWRLLLNRIPVDCKLQSRRISLASKCLCCVSSSVESIQHLFLLSPSAIVIWDYFATWFPNLHTPIHTCTDIAPRLGFWHSSFDRALKTHISFIIPCLVVWFIWTERNSCKHRSIPFRTSHVIWQVVHQLRILVAAGKLVPRDWRGCSPQVDFMPSAFPRRRVLRSLMVLWHPPDPPWVKLNTDGSFTAVSAQSGGGGLVRGTDGSLLGAFCTPLSATSSFEAELSALLQGLLMAKEFSMHVWVEMDAAAVVSILNSGQFGSAEARHTMAHIRHLLRHLQVRFSHIFREGNRAADFLAGRGAQTPTLTFYDSISAPPFLKALVRMDQLGYPNFRFRYRDG